MSQGFTTDVASKIRETSGPTALTVGAVADGQVLKRSGSTVIGGAAPASIGYIYGFPLAYGSTTTVVVGFPNANGPTSICRDKADADNITLAAGTTYTVTITSNGAALGDDSFTGPGTAACNNGTTITGTSTTFKSSFVTRAATGTYSSSGTAVTGNGSKFLSEVAVNDLFGGATNGWSRVTSIASDTSLTLSAALPNGDASAGTTGKIIEQPTISITSDGASPHQVATIASDTSLTVTEATTGGNLSGKTYYIGRLYARAAVSAAQYLYLWLGKGASGTTAYVSTQRTTPFGITNYNVSVRRIGYLLLDSSGNIVPHSQYGEGPLRFYNWENAFGAGLYLLNGFTATTWTAFNCNTLAPPTAVAINISIQPQSANALQLRPRNLGSSTTSRPWEVQGVAGTINFITPPGIIACDGAQALDAVMSAGGSPLASAYYVGCLERL